MAVLQSSKERLAVELGRLRDPVVLRDDVLGDDDKGRGAGTGGGGKIRLLEFFEPHFTHGFERQLPLLGPTLLDTGQTLSSCLPVGSAGHLKRFIH